MNNKKSEENIKYTYKNNQKKKKQKQENPTKQQKVNIEI